MKITDITRLIDGRIVCSELPERLDREINHAFASDLMSDVLTLSLEDVVLITGLANIQTIRTAEMADISYIVFVRNKKITEDMKKIAEENGIILVECASSMYKVSGELYAAGLKALF